MQRTLLLLALALAAVSLATAAYKPYTPFRPSSPPKPPVARPPRRPPGPPPSPPKAKKAPPMTLLSQLVGTWSGVCTQTAVLSGTIQNGTVKAGDWRVIKWAPDNSSTKCGPNGLDVHYDFNATFAADGTYSYSRTSIRSNFRDVFYTYGPAVNNATGMISAKNVTYPSARQCLSITGLTNQPKESKILVVLDGEEYTEEGYYDAKTNKLTNACAGMPVTDKSPGKLDLGMFCNYNGAFKYRCSGYKLGSKRSPPPPKKAGHRSH